MHIQYSKDGNVATYCGYKFRRDPKTGYYLSSRNTDTGHRERLHCFVWRMHNGEIPNGYHIHHKDEDKRNNDIENLDCIPKSDHCSLHGKERAENEHDKVIKNLRENVAPKAAEWHKSKAGREWHSKQAKLNVENMDVVPFACQNCGKVFYAKPVGQHKFCSNNCKAAARRKSGVDNETRKCVVCGEEYVCNKYSKQRCCGPTCSSALRWDQRNQKNRETACL